VATIEKRKNKDGTTSYRVKVRKRGFPHASKTFATLAEAKGWADGRIIRARTSFLFRLEAAARMLGLDAVDLLEFAREVDGVSGPLRLCVGVPDDVMASLMRFPAPQTEPAGMKPADRTFAYIHAPNTPAFFRRLGTNGVATLASGDSLVMLDGSGWIWADGLIVELKGCWVPRPDIEAVAKALAARRAAPE